jgi:septum formation protein
MLQEKGFTTVIMPPYVDESIPANIAPHIAVMYLALKKALHVEAMRPSCNHMIVAADTAVIYADAIIGKPGCPEEAYEILKKLCGCKHTVLTGVAMISQKQAVRKLFYESTDVYFKNYPDKDIFEYAKTPEPYDKAGGYAIQGAWGDQIERIEGDRDNVVGFPWSRFEAELQYQ